jgi:long-subunit fatty acid transport protein
MNILKKLSIILFALLTAPLFAQNVNDALRVTEPGLGPNARALGMGNAYIGLSDDASAMYFNPAGLGLLKRLEFSGGLNYMNYGNEATYFGTVTPYSGSSTSLNRVSFAFPFPTVRGSLVFGLSYHQNKDFTSALQFDAFNPTDTSYIQDLNVDTEIPFELYLTDNNYNTLIKGRLQSFGDVLTSGSINNWTLSAAIEAYRNLFIGINLNIISGGYESNHDYFEEDVLNLYQGETAPGVAGSRDFRRFKISRIIDWDIAGWDAKLGILYQLPQNARFGMTIQFPKQFAIGELFSRNASATFATTTYEDNYRDDQRIEYIITTPFELSAGASINLSGLILSGEATFADQSQIKFTNERGLNSQDVANINRSIRNTLGTTFRYNVGAEYTIPAAGVRLRSGFISNPSAHKVDPIKRKYVTAGFGFLIDETIGLDLGYAYGWWDDYGDNFGNNIARTFQKITVNNFMLSATYRF